MPMNSSAGTCPPDFWRILPRFTGLLSFLPVREENSAWARCHANWRNGLISPFQVNVNGQRPVHAGSALYRDDPAFHDLILFYEYFHGDTARESEPPIKQVGPGSWPN